MDTPRDWLTLIHAPGVGVARLLPVLRKTQSAADFLNAGPAGWKKYGFDEQSCEALRSPHIDGIERDLLWLKEPGNHLLGWTDHAYPAALREIARPPLALYCTGDIELLSHPQLAIVGSRNPTRDGLDQAHEFAKLLAAHGLGICSGLALGVDAAAHEGALAADGITIAVFGTGLDRVYPAKHRDLATRIAAHGVLVSEFPCGSEARPAHFPQRNRIVTGLSRGVLVVEAADRSGSLISARTAMEQGREVFAIPGSINNPLKRGCHRLIREGAKLVESAQDIVEEIGPLLHNNRFAPGFSAASGEGSTTNSDRASGNSSQDPLNDGGLDNDDALDDDYRQLLDDMGYEPVRIDRLVERSGLRIDVLSSMLLMLELQDHVQQVPGGAYQRRPDNTAVTKGK